MKGQSLKAIKVLFNLVLVNERIRRWKGLQPLKEVSLVKEGDRNQWAKQEKAISKKFMAILLI